ncbi:MAG: chemotaxis protein CheA [Desulfamplus sp.]|nr:chemotaxis protein CheA [Desulfamplus sp.]
MAEKVVRTSIYEDTVKTEIGVIKIMEEYDIDPEVLAGFIDETIENLQAAEQMFIHLEENPDDIEIVNAIFRPIHSLKGTSGFFGLIKTKELAHNMENLLDAVRKGEKKATKEVIDALLPGIDQLNLIFQRVRSGEEEVAGDAQSQKYEAIKTKVEQILLSKDSEKLETNLKSSLTEKDLSEATPDKTPNIIEDIIEKLNFIRPIIPEYQIDTIDAAMEVLFIMSAQNEAQIEKEQNRLDRLEKAKFEDKKDALDLGEELGQNLALNSVKDDDKIEQNKVSDGKSQTNQKIAQSKAKKADKHQEAADKTMRVSEKSIDSFLEYVGELVVVEEMFNYLQKKLASLSLDQNISKNFKRVIETFSNLSDSLRNSILEIRSVPAQALLQKAPRIIRTVADDAGKLVDVTIEGEHIRIDKSYVELLDAPLTHMVRNAVDHGIELPSERIAAGKPERGSVKITIQENRENIELIVSEDGRGLNLAAISAKAIEMGLITRGQKLDENRIIDMLFMSGVSTAKEVTDVSGRGVGMDVVKKNIDSAGGFINVETNQGQGTTFKITLPKSVSTQIVDGFLIKSGKETYVLPMEIIGESFVPQKKDVSTVSGGKGEMVLRRGVLMSVVHLSTILGTDKKADAQKDSNLFESKDKVMITIEIGEKNYALCVDDILGVQKVVVKHVDALPVDGECFEGAAMMGDGSVAMIISVEGLKKIALQQL